MYLFESFAPEFPMLNEGACKSQAIYQLIKVSIGKSSNFFIGKDAVRASQLSVQVFSERSLDHRQTQRIPRIDLVSEISWHLSRNHESYSGIAKCRKGRDGVERAEDEISTAAIQEAGGLFFS